MAPSHALSHCGRLRPLHRPLSTQAVNEVLSQHIKRYMSNVSLLDRTHARLRALAVRTLSRGRFPTLSTRPPLLGYS